MTGSNSTGSNSTVWVRTARKGNMGTRGGRAGREIGIIAEQPAPALHLAHPEGCAVLRIVLFTVPRYSRSCEHLPDGFNLHLLLFRGKRLECGVWCLGFEI